MSLATRSGVRYTILGMLFLVCASSYGDRVTLAIAGTSISKALHLDAVRMGYLFSGFSLAYVIGQLPAGGLLDRFGSKRIYGLSIVGWSICALLMALAGYLPASIAFAGVFLLRFLSGLVQSPLFPGNGRIVAAWFPATERGLASAVFNAGQYFALVLFAPILGWITHWGGWTAAFWFIGILGLTLSVLWVRTVYSVKDHPRISPAEVELIERGGGLVNMDFRGGTAPRSARPPIPKAVLKLLGSRMMVGIYLGQYCITTLTWFYLTWFPLYLAQARHMSIVKVGFAAALPALLGSAGGVLGGIVSDRLLRAGRSLTFARKAPVVAGMLLAVIIVACNYSRAQWAVLLIISLAFFGKGFGGLGWTVVADTSPLGMVGVNGGLFNLIGNLSGITAPLIIGYLVKKTGSYDDALIYVAAMALMTIVSYVFIVGEIGRLVLPETP